MVYLPLILLTLLLLLLYTLVGRLVTAHAGDRAHLTTPFTSLFAGLGLWSLFWLGLGGLLGASYSLVFILFALGGCALVLGMFRVFHIDSSAEHYFTQPLLGLLVLLPLLGWAAASVPQLASDYTLYLHHAAELFYYNGFGTTTDLNRFTTNHSGAPLAHIWALGPLSFALPNIPESAWAVANTVLLIFVAGGLLQAGGLKLKWSNLPLLTGAALLGLTALNPFFSIELLLSSTPHLWLAAALLALALPLLDPIPLPRGLATLPSALIAAWVSLLHPAGLWLVITLTAWWTIRLLIERTDPLKLKDILGLSLLICLPLIGWLLWQYTLQLRGLPTVWPQWVNLLPTSNPTPWLIQLVHLMIDRPLAILLTLTIFGRTLWLLRQGDFNNWFQQHSHTTLPGTLALIYLLAVTLNIQNNGGAGKDLELALIHLQYLLLLPLWQLARHLWARNGWEHYGFRHPWLVGSILLTLVLGHQWLQRGNWPPTPSPQLQHTLQASQALRQQLPGLTPLAVLDPPPATAQAAQVLQQGLIAHTPVQDITPSWQQTTPTRGGLHSALQEAGFKHLWLHAPDETQQRLLGAPLHSDRSYLFAITEQGLQLISTLPHPSYHHVPPPRWRYP